MYVSPLHLPHNRTPNCDNKGDLSTTVSSTSFSKLKVANHEGMSVMPVIEDSATTSPSMESLLNQKVEFVAPTDPEKVQSFGHIVPISISVHPQWNLNQSQNLERTEKSDNRLILV